MVGDAYWDTGRGWLHSDILWIGEPHREKRHGNISRTLFSFFTDVFPFFTGKPDGDNLTFSQPCITLVLCKTKIWYFGIPFGSEHPDKVFPRHICIWAFSTGLLAGDIPERKQEENCPVCYGTSYPLAGVFYPKLCA